MSSSNKRVATEFTHEGGKAMEITPTQALRRSVMSGMLWEDTFYESGEEVVKRIMSLAKEVDPEKVSNMAIEAREKMNLRHMPLIVALALDQTGKAKVGSLVERVIQRADEITEILAIAKKLGIKRSHQVSKGIARAFNKFNAYQLAKYNRTKGKEFTLRDAMFLTHPKAKDKEQEEVFKKLADNTLESPDTWEVALSAGEDKKRTFERLIAENKLGGLALLRNLRNMEQAGVAKGFLKNAISAMNVDRILPFRFIAAARYAPGLESAIEEKMLESIRGKEALPGNTVVLVDISGSMEQSLSDKSDMTCIDAACGVAAICRELCESVSIYSFSNDVVKVPDRRGFSLIDAIRESQHHGGTHLGRAIQKINEKEKYDRIIVITDEQSADNVGYPEGRGYMINVSTNKNGVGYGKWMHIDGFSEAVVDYIIEYEKIF